MLISKADLLENADFIIDALADNEPGTGNNNNNNAAKRKTATSDSAIAEAVSWALGCTPLARTTPTPIYSIDLPSNTDPDTGEPALLGEGQRRLTWGKGALPANAIWSITPSAVIALGLVKLPSVKAKYNLFLVDIGLPMVSYQAGV